MSFSLTDITGHEEIYQIERDILNETGYSGDVDTSFSESSEPQSSDSEDDISSKGNIFRSKQIKIYLSSFRRAKRVNC